MTGGNSSLIIDCCFFFLPFLIVMTFVKLTSAWRDDTKHFDAK
jgi:hypothetical protein